jgi:hypothetical protein
MSVTSSSRPVEMFTSLYIVSKWYAWCIPDFSCHVKANRTPHGEGECGFHRSPRALALRITDGGRLPQT